VNGNDDEKTGGRLLAFPRVFLPSSFDAPGSDSDQDATDRPDRVAPSAPAGVWPSALPSIKDMAPPLALTMPGIPSPRAEDADGGELALPQPEDPEAPTARETLQVCMALVTALGVAAAQGLWHRARHRQALADQARAHADKARGKAAGHHSGGGSPARGGKGGGLLAGSRQEGGRGKRRGGLGGGSGTGRGGGRGGGAGSKGTGKGPKSPMGGLGRRGRGGSPETPKGKKRKRRVEDGLGAKSCIKNRKPRKAGKKPAKDREASKPPKAAKDGKLRRDKDAPKRKGPAPLKWTAPSKSRPGPGGGKALPPGRKRWVRPGAGPAAGKKGSKRRTKPASASGSAWWLRWRTPGFLKRWWTLDSEAHPQGGRRTRTRRSWTWRAKSRPGAQPSGGEWERIRPPGWQRQERTAPPPPPPGSGSYWRMRPPPAADRTVRVEHAERIDVRPQPQHQSDRPTSKAVTGAGRPALNPAPSTPATPRPATSPARDEGPTAPPTVQPAGDQMTRPMIPAGAVPSPRPASVAVRVAAVPLHGVQYDDDAELTIRDVIEAAQDAAEEITQGVEAARATAVGAERMAGRLEALHAELVDLKVPGWLAAIWVHLVDKALHVSACATGLAEALPAASEAITVAAGNAAARDLGVADTTRDHGHIRPAEREYHDE
jgi:hypothetical protein